MKVKVKYFTTLRELAGSSEEEIELRNGETLEDLIDKIASRYGREAQEYLYSKKEKREIDPSIYFLINGVNYRTLSGLKTKLKDGDIIAIIPPIGGGWLLSLLDNSNVTSKNNS